ncbi:motility associated factor glycosyltransferase family protein [Ureibacillus sinduriensis]|uniref:6-hydroxymethylpterin diphosphokinase MptE-like domain-containing protein n=1 Tax=Ureibacillus sinduriensis BLB-1 = JCM 15800 TaxID=1384057 RepID=A0A0A3HV69_9BACL|nr:6-hydroxymethylpterin diphosphokinase MptE-like protein [Ureibacillus sinduriensis]KGR76496.1 hypothetical protein CD33_06395 [Ureibacillus sinduriensis BLB-1 = JCM 15800]
MNWEIVTARNGEKSLTLNGISIYSKYRPREEAWRWIESEIDSSAENYLLIGLGLGYHLEKLVDLAHGKDIYVYYFEEIEKQFMHCNYDKVRIVSSLEDVNFSENTQVMIPNVWIKAIGEENPLYPFLEDIKINQVSYKRSKEMMEYNLLENVKLGDSNPYPKSPNKTAFLVSSGPSLNETIHLIKEAREDIDIFVVGSALKMVLEHNINPYAVIISDPKHNIKRQLENVDYNGTLFYLSTANHDTVTLHKGKRHILFQKGYKEAETFADNINFPHLETGGSVATIAFSLIEYLGYENLILFGQDLAFKDNATHAQQSTSGRTIKSKDNYKTVISNSKIPVKSSTNLMTYLRWFNQRMEQTKMKVYNTALYGAKINRTPYINEQQFHKLLSK